MTTSFSASNTGHTPASHEEGLRRIIEERSNVRPGSVNNRMAPEFVSCSEDGKTCITRYFLKPEMSNPMGWLHGGVTSAMLDMAMGALAYYHKQAICPTSTMTVNFLRPNRIGKYMVVKAHVDFLGKKIVHLSAQAWMEDNEEQLTATSTGSYSVIGGSTKETLSDKIGRLH